MTSRGRPIKPEAYQTLLRHYNKQATQVECECGKLVRESQYEDHQKTKMHERLMTMKERFTEVFPVVACTDTPLE